MRATDLPYDVRRQLLVQIREQVGQTNYDKMINAVGEDGLLDLAIEKAGVVTREQVGAEKKSPRSWFTTIAWAAIVTGVIYMMIAFPQTFWENIAVLLFLLLPGILSGLWDYVKNNVLPH